jgi:gallate decarboxylase subunit D
VIELSRSRGRVAVRLTAARLGADLALTLSGGDRPHIGAVAVSQPRPSLLGGGGTSTTTSVIALLGHKEDELARQVAARVALATAGTVCVACGIHLEAISAAELEDVRALAEELATELLVRLAAGGA